MPIEAHPRGSPRMSIGSRCGPVEDSCRSLSGSYLHAVSMVPTMKLGFHIDKSTITGIVIALAGIGAGLLIEGGKLAQVLQPTAALIVFGGTLGAVMIQFPLPVVVQAFVQLKNVFLGSEPQPDALIQNLLRYAYKARKEGLLS